MIGDLTPGELADIYVETLDSPPNAWGQHVHPQFGQAHNIMWILREAVGDEMCQKLIRDRLERREVAL